MFTGVFTIQNVKPTAEGESSKVKVKARVNLNGILTIASAALTEKREPNKEEMEQEEIKNSEQNNAMNVDNNQDKKDKPDQEAQANEPPAPEVFVLNNYERITKQKSPSFSATNRSFRVINFSFFNSIFILFFVENIFIVSLH